MELYFYGRLKQRYKMYAVESSLETTDPIMLLNQPIGFDANDPGSPYIDGALFQQELLQLDNMGYKSIKIYINCPGGNVTAGWSICNGILHSKTPVDIYNVGMCASMGAAIFLTGRKRIMCDYACLMIHNPFGGDDKKMLSVMKQSYITLIAGKSTMKPEEISYLMDRETWFTSSQCLENGFCTEIQVTSESNQKRMPSASVKAVWKEANLIQANIFNLKQDNNMETNTPQGKILGTSLIAAYLDLDVNASESSVLSAMKTKLNTEILAKEGALDEAGRMKKKLDKMKADYDEMESKYNAIMKEKSDGEAKAKKDAEEAEANAKKEKEDAEAKAATALAQAKKIEAKAMVEKFSKPEGGNRIKVEAIEDWTNSAVALGVDKVKAMLENLPLNKVAPGSAEAVIAKADGTTVDPNKVAANAMSYQAKIQAAINARKKVA